MKALELFENPSRYLNVSDEVLATLVLAEATFELAEAKREQSRVIEEGVVYLVKNWPTP